MSPGPAVTQIPSTSDASTSAASSARRSVGTMACRWAREATSGTTPPKRTCCSTELATSFDSSSCPRTTATPVSSQLDSLPMTSGSLTIPSPGAAP